jgi:hypothetical protein
MLFFSFFSRFALRSERGGAAFLVALSFILSLGVALTTVGRAPSARAQVFSASTQAKITVSPQPLAIFFDGEAAHVLCNQIDANFNGAQDEGDIPASWVRFPIRNGVLQESERAIRRFAWNEAFGFPARPAFDSAAKVFYFAQSGRIRSFDARTQTVLRDTIALIDSIARRAFETSGSVSALSLDRQRNSLLISLRGRSTSAVVELELATSRILARYPGGIFVQQALPYVSSTGRRGVAILNEGAFGSNTSTLMLARSPEDIVTIPLGNTGNHIVQLRDEIIVTMNGSHEIVAVDLNAESVARRIPTGTNGFDGPRETAILPPSDVFAVTTYSGAVKFFDSRRGSTLASVQTQSKSEGIAVLNSSTILVADAFIVGGFASLSTITPISIAQSVSSARLNSNASPARVSVQPNPVRNVAILRFETPSAQNDNARAELLNALGAKIASLEVRVSGGVGEITLDADALNLPNGFYFVRAFSHGAAFAEPLRVQR